MRRNAYNYNRRGNSSVNTKRTLGQTSNGGSLLDFLLPTSEQGKPLLEIGISLDNQSAMKIGAAVFAGTAFALMLFGRK